MIGIEAIGTYLPEARVDNRERAARFDCDEEFLTGKLGVEEIATAAPEEDAASLAIKAFENLRTKREIDPELIEAAILVTQTPGDPIPHVSAKVHGALGLPNSCACFDISLGCSGYVYALAVVKALMEAQGYRKGLIFTADPYTKIVDPEDRNTAMLFGDGASVTLLSESPVFAIGKTTMKTDGTKFTGLVCHENRLTMNGRAVFNFCAQKVPPDIREAVELNGLMLADVDQFLLHQGSKFIVDAIQSRLGVPAEKVPFGAGGYGNTVSSSVPLLLAEALDSPETRRIVLSGFGVGLSWASTVVTRID